MTVHEAGCTCDSYACELRRKNVGISDRAIPTRVTSRKQQTVKVRDAPSWEAGRVGHHNRDGTFVPIITERGTHLRVKEYGERRHEIDEKLKRKRMGLPAVEST